MSEKTDQGRQDEGRVADEPYNPAWHSVCRALAEKVESWRRENAGRVYPVEFDGVECGPAGDVKGF